MDRLSSYERARVDVIEMGLKADDPMMDGDIVANSMRRSNGKGAVAEAIATARRLRELERPLPGILLCYPKAQVQQADEEWSEIDAVLCLDTGSHARRDIAARAQRR